jgi:hypothetical protein
VRAARRALLAPIRQTVLAALSLPRHFWRPLDPAHLEKKVERALAGRTAAPADSPGNGR